MVPYCIRASATVSANNWNHFSNYNLSAIVMVRCSTEIAQAMQPEGMSPAMWPLSKRFCEPLPMYGAIRMACSTPIRRLSVRKLTRKLNRLIHKAIIMGSQKKNERAKKLGHFSSVPAFTLAANAKANAKIQRICEIISKQKSKIKRMEKHKQFEWPTA